MKYTLQTYWKMRWALSLILIFLFSCGNHRKQEKYEANPNCVYVCTGNNAKRYHSIEDCKGLSKCSGEIIEMTIDEAEEEGKTPCKLCVK